MDNPIGTPAEMPRFKGVHAHVYVTAETLVQACELCEIAVRLFPVRMGRMHQQPVGPRPNWSRQLAFKPELFSTVTPWMDECSALPRPLGFATGVAALRAQTLLAPRVSRSRR